MAVKHLADDVALLVLDDPWLILVAVLGAEGFKTSLGCVVHVLAVDEQLPRPYVAVVHSVQHNAHALVGCDERADTKNKSDGCQGPVSSTSAAQSDDQGNDDAGGNETDAKCASEEHAGRVTVADRPSDKIGVSLVPKTGVDCLEDAAESTWVGCPGECYNYCLLLRRREVQLSRSAVHDVCYNHSVDLFSEWLNSN